MPTQSSSSILSRLAVAASIAALSLSATAETRFWADSNGASEKLNRAESWDPAPSSMSDVEIDTLVLNKGVEKIATFEVGDSVTAANLYVGRGANNPGGRLDVSGGNLSVTNDFIVGADASSVSNVVNITGGRVSVKRLRTGTGRADGTRRDVVNISGEGTVFEATGEETRLSADAGGISEMNIINGATYSSPKTFVVGYAGSATLVLDGGTFELSGDHDLNVCNGGGANAVVDFRSGSATIHTLNITQNGGTGVVNIGADCSLVTSWAFYMGANAELNVNGVFDTSVSVNVGNRTGGASVVNLNGDGTKRGLIKTTEFVAVNNNATLNWNGGRLMREPSGFIKVNDVLPAVSAQGAQSPLKVVVGANGAYYESENSSSDDSISQSLSGVGAFNKLGGGTLTLKGALNIQGGFKVEGGTLNITGMEQGTFDELSVAEGCSLDLGGASVSVKRYVQNGQEMPAGDHSYYNGSIHVFTAEEISAAVSKWTNAAGDGDVTNPANWDSWNAVGTMVVAAPTADTHIIVPYVPGGMLFEGFSDVTWVVEENVNAEVSNRPEVLKTAAAWYDPSDVSTLTTNETGKVTEIANKGVAGTALDLERRTTSKNGAGLSTEGFNGRSSIFYDGGSGYRSKNSFPGGLTADIERTLFAVAKGDNTKMIMLSVAKKASPDEEGRHLLEAHNADWGRAYKVGISNDGGNNWEGKTVDFKESHSDTAYVFAGRSAKIPDGEQDQRSVISSVASVTESARLSEPTIVNMPKGHEGLDYRVYYGVFEIGMSWVDCDSDGYQGEALIFTNALSDAEMDEVNEYLRTKWLLSDGPVMTEVSNIVVEAELNLCGGKGTFASITGRGSFKNGTVVLNGDLIVTVNPDQSVVAPSFDKLVLGENARLVVNGAKNLPTKGTINILSFASLQGEFKSVVGDRNTRVILRYLEDHVCARRDAGMIVTLR